MKEDVRAAKSKHSDLAHTSLQKVAVIIMTLIIVTILLMGLLLIATSHLTNVNKAAIAMFIGTVGWVVYICFGTDFVMAQHPREYADFLAGSMHSSQTVKYFIYDSIFLKYVGKAASVVLFLLATMNIVEILDNNGCFDFFSQWIRTRNSKRLLWTITIATFIISANLDNLTTTVTMLTIMHGIVQNRRQRMLIGCCIVIAATAGGCITVIGNPEGVVLWGDGAITATNFSAYLALPCLTAWIVPTWLIGMELPERLDVEWPTMPYRGDDTNLNVTQRLVMLIVGIGGLWFIPTFHNITKLSPFLGALCVLSLLWIVNEIFNRKLMKADQMSQRRTPRVLQYGSIQMMLFVMGILLCMGVLKETGILSSFANVMDTSAHSVWTTGIVAGLLSGIVDSFTVFMTSVSMYNIVDPAILMHLADSDYVANFVQNGIYWKLIAFSTAMGGCLFGYSNLSGLAMMKMERIHVGWYVKHCSPKVFLGWLLGIAILFAEHYMELNI